jgi:small subunit ribosomal protein S14
MAKLGKIITNEKRRKLVARYASRIAACKATLSDPGATPEERARAAATMASIPRNAHAARVRNRCHLTGRPRAYLRKFGLSRIAMRDCALRGEIPGVIKSSW